MSLRRIETTYEFIDSPEVEQRLFNALKKLINLDDIYEQQNKNDSVSSGKGSI